MLILLVEVRKSLNSKTKTILIKIQDKFNTPMINKILDMIKNIKNKTGTSLISIATMTNKLILNKETLKLMT